MVVVFVLVALLVLAALVAVHWYMWRRLVRDTTVPGGLGRRLGTAAFLLGALLLVGALTSRGEFLPFAVRRAVSWPGYLWMAGLLYVPMALALTEPLRPLLRRALARRDARRAGAAAPAASTAPAAASSAAAPAAASAASGTTAAAPGTTAAAPGTASAPAAGSVAVDQASASAPVPAPAKDAEDAEDAEDTDGTPAEGAAGAQAAEATDATDAGTPPRTLSRRLFVARTVGSVAAVAGLGTVGAGTYGVLNGPGVKRVTVPLARLPRAAHGFRIAVVSDVHLSPVLGRSFAQRVVDIVNSTQPDLIAVVGDLVDGSVRDLGPAAAPLAGLRARHGAYFVTGNHEYFSGAEEWVDEVRDLGLRPMENIRTEFAHFDLAGVNDIAGEDHGQGPDFAKALGDRDPSRPVVLLSHQPVTIDEAVKYGVDLQLSGHTHGGQLWPGPYLAELANPTVAGLEKYGDTQLYVSRGAGAWGPPTRVGAPSDVTVVELASLRA
ncbi:metallophosphoesterase [Streptomyces sp. NPDC002734]|uniref:metallophosphoesterase n=1 Tax=Streptomyces sp. NPDC002734 TaxID=3154426 RepID=UPI00331A1ED9